MMYAYKNTISSYAKAEDTLGQAFATTMVIGHQNLKRKQPKACRSRGTHTTTTKSKATEDESYNMKWNIVYLHQLKLNILKKSGFHYIWNVKLKFQLITRCLLCLGYSRTCSSNFTFNLLPLHPTGIKPWQKSEFDSREDWVEMRYREQNDSIH